MIASAARSRGRFKLDISDAIITFDVPDGRARSRPESCRAACASASTAAMIRVLGTLKSPTIPCVTGRPSRSSHAQSDHRTRHAISDQNGLLADQLCTHRAGRKMDIAGQRFDASGRLHRGFRRLNSVSRAGSGTPRQMLTAMVPSAFLRVPSKLSASTGLPLADSLTSGPADA